MNRQGSAGKWRSIHAASPKLSIVGPILQTRYGKRAVGYAGMSQEPIPLPVTLEPGASMPAYATGGAAGMDVRCLQGFRLNPMERLAVGTGIRVAVPEGYEIQIRPRSGLALNNGVTLANSPGTIDSDYRGEIRIILVNLGLDVVEFEQGDRIAQMILCPVAQAHPMLVRTLEETTRGDSGFGSTGRS
jgi:dUTP pyrophosphatase